MDLRSVGRRLFDIHDEPDKFARAVVGYATMDDNMTGLDTFVERKDGQITSIAEMRCRDAREAAVLDGPPLSGR